MSNSNLLPEYSHFPVMLKEVIKICSPEEGGNYLDCTFGGGGYSKAILKYPKTKVIAIDRDEHVKSKAKKIKRNIF
jgi:16S rRNA (cytosine1402-N4)-methyltransferase